MMTPRTMPPITKPDTLKSYAVDATIYQDDHVEYAVARARRRIVLSSTGT